MSHRRAVRSLLSACAAVGVGVVGAFAMHDAAVVAAPVTSDPAKVDLRVDTGDPMIGFSSLHVDGMRPGDSTAGVLTVENTGRVPLDYHVDATTADGEIQGFGAALMVKVTDDPATVGSGRAKSCPGDRLAATAEAFAPMLVGSGDSGRTLAAGATETLCIQARLPSWAPSRLQGATTHVELEVVATP